MTIRPAIRPAIRLAILSLAATLPIASALSAQIAVPAAATTPVRPAAQKAADVDAARPAAARIDEKAKAIYDKGVAVARALKSIDLMTQMKLDMEDVDPALLPPGFGSKSRVRIRFSEGEGAGGGEGDAKAGVRNQSIMFGGELVVERLDGGKVVERFVAGKDRAILVMPEAKTYATSDEWSRLAGVAVVAIPQWILEQRASGRPDREEGGMVMPASTMLSAELAGVETIDDLECDVVKAVREIDMASIAGAGELPEGMPATLKLAETIAFARADGLPRRIAMVPMMGGMDEAGGMAMPAGPSTTYTAVAADVELADEDFSTTPPEGFTKVDPPSDGFGLVVGGDAGGNAAAAKPGLAIKVGDPAPEFSLKDAEGKVVTLASLKGRVVVLDFWATWCGPCKAAMPAIQKLADDYAGRDVAVFGVNVWEGDPALARKYMESKKFTYGCLFEGDELARAYGVQGIPTLVVLDRGGRVVEIEIGLSDSGGRLRKAVDAALAGK